MNWAEMKLDPALLKQCEERKHLRIIAQERRRLRVLQVVSVKAGISASCKRRGHKNMIDPSFNPHRPAGRFVLVARCIECHRYGPDVIGMNGRGEYGVCNKAPVSVWAGQCWECRSNLERFTPLIKCDLCARLGIPRRVQERDVFGWDLPHDKRGCVDWDVCAGAHSKTTLCASCWNRVKPIALKWRVIREGKNVLRRAQTLISKQRKETQNGGRNKERSGDHSTKEHARVG